MDAGKRICGRLPDSDYVELAVEIFAMLADATRVRLIIALRDAGELSVNQPIHKTSPHSQGSSVSRANAEDHAVKLFTIGL